MATDPFNRQRIPTEVKTKLFVGNFTCVVPFRLCTASTFAYTPSLS